jgi:hypothetical protein
MPHLLLLPFPFLLYHRFSEAYVDDIAHDIEVECSNVGKCNRLTGECECQYGYEVPEGPSPIS